MSLEKDLPDQWSPDPKADDNNLIWKQPYGGRSTPIIMNGRVYLINSAGEGVDAQERVMCFDADTGQVLWQRKFNVFHTDIDILRVGWTNLAGDPETGNIHVHGTQGLFLCLDKDGKVLWSHSLTEEYGRVGGYGGRLTSPVVDGGLVIIGMINASWGEQAGPGNRFLAVNKRTGVPVWWSSPAARPKDTYASVPVVAEIHGRRLLISGGGDGAVHAIKVQTGEPVWSYTIGTGGISSSPVVDANLVFICHGGGNPDSTLQGRIVCLDASRVQDGKPTRVWEKLGIKVRYTSPLLQAGRLYICDEAARMHCFEAATGKKLWTYKYGRNAKGSPVWADGKIYVGDVNGRFHILKPDDRSCQELHVQFFPSPDGVSEVEINGNAAVANGRVYFTTSFEFYCLGKKDHKAAARKAAPAPTTSAATDAKPAHLQIVPADIVLEPGESADFKARLFDRYGHFLKEVKAKWSLEPMRLPPTVKAKPPPLRGDITADGKLTVDDKLPGQFGTVVASAQGLTAAASVRVVPRLPYRQDFERVPIGAAPAGWVNCQGKFVVVEKDGSKVLKKLATNASPLFARANAFIGKPGLRDYTIQADLLGARKGQDMPDMGLVANRYILMLDGNKQHLRIVSWESTPHARVDKTIDWPWKPGVWYRLKMTVQVEGQKALVHGKVWERDRSEPNEWSIQFEDPTPNRHGSPALYAYVTGILENEPGAEIFYDNVSVTPNKGSEARTQKSKEGLP